MSYVEKLPPARQYSEIKRPFRKHAIKRVQERYGMSLTKNDIDRIVKRMKNGQFEKPIILGRNGEVRVTEFGGKRLPFVWHRRKHHISTVLPPEWLVRQDPDAHVAKMAERELSEEDGVEV